LAEASPSRRGQVRLLSGAVRKRSPLRGPCVPAFGPLLATRGESMPYNGSNVVPSSMETTPAMAGHASSRAAVEGPVLLNVEVRALGGALDREPARPNCV